MAYIYQISMNITPDQMDELTIGASLERVLGYLRTLLPSQNGYITSRAMRSVSEEKDAIRVIFESVWQDWDAFEAHRASNLAEDKIVLEFGPDVDPSKLLKDTFVEVD
jgi:heme-degrading monooxygenase HmoA